MKKSFKNKPVLILGVGNILMKDEGVGVHAANFISENSAMGSQDIEVLDGGTAGFGLLTHMMYRKRIVIIDAFNFDDVAGSIYIFNFDEIVVRPVIFSLHQVGIIEVVRTLRMMGENPEIDIVGVVPEDISSFEIGLSDSVKQALPDAVNLALEMAMTF